MELLLVRHAIAEPAAAGQADAERPLSARGRERFEACVRGLSALELDLDRVLHSPLLRAVQTADLLADLLRGESVVTPTLAAPPGSQLLALLQSLDEDERVALVGHEPWMSATCALLLTGSRACESFPFKKGGVAWLEGRPTPGGARLRGFFPPGALAQIGV